MPRSLRWDVNPQEGDSDLESWFKYFNEAGTKFPYLVITKKRNRLSAFDREIKDLKDKLIPLKNLAQYSSLLSNLQNHLEKEEKDQRNKKQKKYSRDVGDYKSGVVFNWQKKMKTSETIPNDSSNTLGVSGNPVGTGMGFPSNGGPI